MTTRSEFIAIISTILGRETIPDKPSTLTYRHSVHTDVMRDWPQEKITEAFIDNSKAIGVSVLETTQKDCARTVQEILSGMKDGAVAVTDEHFIDNLNLTESPAQNREIKKWDINGTREENIDYAEKAIAGIAVAEMALAETGTVLLYCRGSAGRSVTLLPEATIYLIPQSRIQPRLTQALAHIEAHTGELPSSINLVSGPSATADIELVRVVGVHGPVAVVYVVISDL